MNDKDLSALIRMAGEAERLEEAAPLRFEWARPDRQDRELRVRKMITGMATLAAAACLGVAALVWMRPPAPTTPTGGGRMAVSPPVVEVENEPAVELVSVPDPLNDRASIVLAVFRDADDRCSCVQLSPADFGKDLALIGSLELFRTALADPCHENPRQVMVIAMQGPRQSLPSSDAEAELIAAAVSEGASLCGGDAMCITSNTAPFVAEGVTVLAGTMRYR